MKAWIGNCLHLGIFLLVALLTGCGGGGSSSTEAPAGPRPSEGINISGKAAVEGMPLTGAVVAISKLDITQASETKSRRGKIVRIGLENFQPAVGTDGVFSFQLPNDLLQDDMLYSLSLTCPNPITDDCPLQAPLHAVISGSRLKQGGFTVNVLTEVVYQRLGYYIAVGFKAPELHQEMNALARMLLDGDIDGEDGIDYEDVLRWAPDVADGSLLKRPAAVTEITTHLTHSEDAAQLQLAVQTLFSPIVATLKTANFAWLIAIKGNYAFVAVGPRDLYAVDITQPSLPKMLNGKIQIPGDIQEMTLVPPFIYVTYHSGVTGGGLQIVDISNPHQLELRGNTPLNGTPSSIQIVGSNAYIAYKPADDRTPNLPSGLHVVHVSEEGMPAQIAELNLDNPSDAMDKVYAVGIAVVGKYAYVTDIWGKVHINDVSTPENPEKIGFAELGGRLCEIKVRNNYAYIANELGGLVIYSLENPEHPARVAEIGTLGIIRRMVFDGDHIYISDSTGLITADISNPHLPKLVNAIDTPHAANDVAVANNLAYVADTDSGIQVIDYSVQPPPLLAGSIASGGVDVVANGDYAYVLSGYPGVKIFDTRDVRNPALSSGASGYIASSSITLAGNYIFAAAGSHIDIFDIREPGELQHKGLLATPGQGKDVAVVGNLAFVAHGYEGLRVVNISDPASPIILFNMDTPGGAHGIDVVGNHAYIADSQYGLQVVKFSQTDELAVSLEPAVRVDTPGSANEVVVSGNIAYVADDQAGLQLIDISNPDKPKLISGVDTPGNAIDVAIVNSIAYVADGYAGVQVIDVRDPMHPVFIGSARTHSGAMGISVSGDHVYVATNYGLEIIQAIPTE